MRETIVVLRKCNLKMKSSTSTHVEFNLPGMDGVTDWTIPPRLCSRTSIQYQKNTDNNDICNITAGLVVLPTPPPPVIAFHWHSCAITPLPTGHPNISKLKWNSTYPAWIMSQTEKDPRVCSLPGWIRKRHILFVHGCSLSLHNCTHTQENRRYRWIQIIKINV